jgi:FAD/FMN-containing dehydrogenase
MKLETEIGKLEDKSNLAPVPALYEVAENIEHVVSVVKFARENGMNVVCRGAGTGMQGGCVPTRDKQIVLDLSKLKSIALDKERQIAVVGPGVICSDLQAEVKKIGLMYPPDPASADISTIGGNIATNAGGMTAFKYGNTKDYVLSLKVVLENGDLVETGCPTTFKDNVGYDLTRLFCGSEGTLGVIVEATLKLISAPEEEQLLVLCYSELSTVFNDVKRLTKFKDWTLFEFLDKTCLDLLRNSSDLEMSSRAKGLFGNWNYALVLRTPESKLEEICNWDNGMWPFISVPETSFWLMRRQLGPGLDSLGLPLIFDFAVNTVDVPELLRLAVEYKRDCEALACFGHLGDGNIHISYMAEKIPDLNEKIGLIDQVVRELKGTFASEHGVGYKKVNFFKWYHPGRYRLCEAIKFALDPYEVFNADKVVRKG